MTAAPSAPVFPRLRHPDPDIQAWADGLVRALEIALGPQARGTTGYAITHLTESRVLDASAASLADVRGVLGTLIEDLRAGGSIA
jgi:hypothetical protein